MSLQDLPTPQSREEEILAVMAGVPGVTLPNPQSRIEEYLKYIAENPSGGASVYNTSIEQEDSETWSCEDTFAELKAKINSGNVVIGNIVPIAPNAVGQYPASIPCVLGLTDYVVGSSEYEAIYGTAVVDYANMTAGLQEYEVIIISQGVTVKKKSVNGTLPLMRYAEERTISATCTNISASSLNASVIYDGETETLYFSTDGDTYRVPTDSPTVTGATAVYSRIDNTHCSIVLSNSTGNVSFTIAGVQYWDGPVQEGEVLTIPQAYSLSQTNNKLEVQ